MTETPDSTPPDRAGAAPEGASPTTALLEPPPGQPPVGTGVAGLPPERPRKKRWIAWTIGIVVAVVFIGSLVGVVVWSLNRNKGGAGFSAYQPAYESAMKKAGVTAPFPAAPVAITDVKATGSHPIDATFTAEEVTALVNAFTYSANIQGTDISVANPTIELAGGQDVRLSASITLNGNSYSGSIEGPVAFENGEITSTGATAATAEGIPVGAARAAQATPGLIEYLNSYLAAAPGLTVASAQVTAEGFHVQGTAPDSLTLP